MQCLKFELSGNYAFFKNPEFNLDGYEFSFEHIHKPAILGILGAILGLKGRQQFKESNSLEYYSKLKDILIAIEPKKKIFDHFEYDFVNATGYANRGYNQIIKRMYLNKPSWNIYLLKNSLDDDIYNTLYSSLKNKESKFPIYLGDNSLKATISDIEEININPVLKDNFVVNSLFKSDILLNENNVLKLYMPTSLKNVSFNYEYEWICISDESINIKQNNSIYNYLEKNLYFF
ncbi:CRISPR-associated protein Cas5 [Clostridium perfringens]|uniref:CRISPR-associated protein Cas5 n=1 Tax=Clostridium perfringens TaxID=1502 RepID=UPI0024476AA4|nr:CRISPR-associated protein Cas5 [Clostridium perfringens]MDH2475762.1 CRISPR-associated protein Cas5 [Clostridium perfringens]